MVVTHNKKKKEKKPDSPKEPALAKNDLVLEGQHKLALDHLQAECMEMDYTIPWLPLTKAASEATRNQMLEVVGGKKKGFGISKRLFNSGHPLIDELNTCRRRLDQWRDGFVIVKSAEATVDEHDRAKIASGVRLIQASDIPQFEQGFKQRVDQLYAALELVQKHMRKPYNDGKKDWPSILDWDKEQTGTEFNSADYPVDVRDCVKVIMPTYNAYTVSMKLPPAVYERQEKRLQEALNGTLETATKYVCSTLEEVFSTFANQLIDRTRVYPKDVNYGKYHNAEVVTLLKHEDKKSIPEGSVEVTLRYKRTLERPADAPADYKDKEESVTVTLDPMSEADYLSLLKPETTQERKKLTKSVLDNIYLQMEQVSNVSKMLGPYGDKIKDTMVNVKNVLSSGGKSSDEVLEEAKASRSFRTSLSKALNEAVTKLDETAVVVTGVRRRISSKLAGNV